MAEGLPEKRTILFDVDGVLIHGWHAKEEKRRRWDENLQTDLGIDPAEFTATFFPDIFPNQVLTGRISLISALEIWLSERSYDVSPMALISYWFAQDAVVNREMLPILEALSEHGAVRLCLATNQEHLRAAHLWQQVGFSSYFDDMFHAARLGAIKPDPAFFHAVDKRLGRQITPPLLFDDNEDVIAAAGRHGWEAILFEDETSCKNHPSIAAYLAEITHR
ncbi:HAD-IA family hydrolase [Altericroceibacterium endophyticum]|uniref:HAD-IA family hydrolase n=1 Tax=Altericroceibacterium endophyticum TaxID=1808508 RepID=A0A6I4T507_9SPHN|nr:HAD-IA family hydrolase [Altericroceibacterium endophyticum]